jgi:hypothetical protein
MSKIATPVTSDRLKELLAYDAATGIFTWLVNRGKARAGDSAGRHHQGYIFIRIDGQRYAAHRLAWFYVIGAWPASQIDHINEARSDNRISNLRDVSGFFNQQNKKQASSNCQTKLRGVSALYGRYRASVYINGKQKYLGLFDTAEQAHAAYLAEKLASHPGCAHWVQPS